MAAQLKIDQVGLPAGVTGVSRTDGLATGALVTVENTGLGATTLFNLLWTPPGDTTAVLSLAATGNPKIWTFTPTVNVYGTYLIELVEDSVSVERRVLVVRTPNRGLIVPALNEVGDPNASLLFAGTPEIEAADNNATDFLSDLDLNTLQYAAWWRALHEMISSLDDPDEILTSVAPVNVTKAAAVIGVATRAARADHKHDVMTAAPVNVTKAAAAEGTATSLSRSDHKHDVTTAAPVATGLTNQEGSSTSLARADHVHQTTPVDRMLVAGNQLADTTTFQTIGGIQLLAAESTLFTSCTFRVLGFTNNAADACEIRLFNQTTASVVASSTLSFTNIVAAELSANLTLPSGINIYLVQMRLATTGTPNRAACLSARLLAT